MTTERVEIETPGGRMPTFIARPDGGGPFPSVVVIMEAFGLVPHLEGVAERIAGEGYVVAAPDFYFRSLPDNKFGYDNLDGAIACMSKLDDGEFTGDMKAMIDYLNGRSETTGKVGVTGFCMGGRLSFLTACVLPDAVACAAPFYGGGITGHLAQADAIQCPVHLFFGEKDPYIPLDQVDEVRAKLGELGKSFELDCYPGADHGFFCDDRESYDEAAATDSWEKMKALFAAHLKA
ncbi:MAG: dienelactone hydrolase family protein [Myxococcales bacterium]|nr:dienelactone hydrolase family protein [Myxococcales bacterium]